MYLYPTVYKAGNAFKFMQSERINRPAATLFNAKGQSSNGIPGKIVIDRSGANAASTRDVNNALARIGYPAKMQTVRSKYPTDAFDKSF